MDPALDQDPDVAAAPQHDHAWRRVRAGSERYGGAGEYRCDLCPARWEL